MKLEVKELGDVKRDLHIEVDQDSLKSLKAKVLDRISKEANVPGFRKGKAPADLLEKRYSGLVKDELLKEAGVLRAKGLVSATDSDADNVYVTLSAKSLNNDLFVVARANLEGRLGS